MILEYIWPYKNKHRLNVIKFNREEKLKPGRLCQMNLFFIYIFAHESYGHIPCRGLKPYGALHNPYLTLPNLKWEEK